MKPYSPAELMRLAMSGRGPQPLEALRVLATYANPENWVQVNTKGDDGKPRHYWGWAGPTIVGYELAETALTDTEHRIAELEAQVGRLQRAVVDIDTRWSRTEWQEPYTTEELEEGFGLQPGDLKPIGGE